MSENDTNVMKVRFEDLPEEKKKKLWWIKEVLGTEEITVIPPRLDFLPGEMKRFIILEDKANFRTVQTRNGNKIIPWFPVYYKGGVFKLELWSKSLAYKLAQIALLTDGLKGAIIRARRPTGDGDDKYWRVWYEGHVDVSMIHPTLLDWDCKLEQKQTESSTEEDELNI